VLVERGNQSFLFLRPLRVVGLFALLQPSTLHSQSLGTVTGEVKDASGAIVAGAVVTVHNTGTNAIRTVTTNEEGRYTVPALIPGTYGVKVEKTGFKTMMRPPFELQVQQTARIDLVLELGQVTETVEVSGAAALLTTENATVGTVMEQRRITDLPLNGRNLLSLVALSPNVTYGSSPAAQAAGRQGGTRAGVTMSLSGARPGATTRWTASPTPIKAQTGIYPAEFGRAAGQVNVSTKGGSNEYHGSAFAFPRNDRLDARPYLFKDPDITPSG
jgi:Carboxypeptidase regulatory-like domain